MSRLVWWIRGDSWRWRWSGPEALPPNQAPNPSQVTHFQSKCTSFTFLVTLHVRPSLSSCPAPYVKVYLLEHGTCKAKKKTKIARKTLEPLYQQHLLFEESPQGKVLQVLTNQHLVHPWSRVQYICMIAVEIMEDHSLPEGETVHTVVQWCIYLAVLSCNKKVLVRLPAGTFLCEIFPHSPNTYLGFLQV